MEFMKKLSTEVNTIDTNKTTDNSQENVNTIDVVEEIPIK